MNAWIFEFKFLEFTIHKTTQCVNVEYSLLRLVLFIYWILVLKFYLIFIENRSQQGQIIICNLTVSIAIGGHIYLNDPLWIKLMFLFWNLKLWKRQCQFLSVKKLWFLLHSRLNEKNFIFFYCIFFYIKDNLN